MRTGIRFVAVGEVDEGQMERAGEMIRWRRQRVEAWTGVGQVEVYARLDAGEVLQVGQWYELAGESVRAADRGRMELAAVRLAVCLPGDALAAYYRDLRGEMQKRRESALERLFESPQEAGKKG